MIDSEPEVIPISMLNQLEYCERRFYLMHVLGEMEINAHVLEGSLRHENVHNPGVSREGETLTHRQMYVWSDDLGIAGFADVVEKSTSSASGGTLTPIEYKKGRMEKWLNDHIQLCAQALCLSEQTGGVVPKGYIFYFGSRHREEVEISAELRARTRQSIVRAHALVAAQQLPPPLENYNKCRDCSLEPICLPREVKILKGEK